MSYKALLIGINKYISRPDVNLRGCVNDVHDIEDFLLNRNSRLDAIGLKNLTAYSKFVSSNIKIIVDHDATTQGILNGLDWLVDGVSSTDKLFFYVSSHGSQVPDFSGDEKDYLSEIICPSDIDFDNHMYISDDDLRSIFSVVPSGALVEVFLDCCHSGDFKVLSANSRSRFMSPPDSWCLDYSLPVIRLCKPKYTVNAFEVIWSSCQDKQTSEETRITGRTQRGVFTYFISKALREHPELDRSNLLDFIKMDLQGSTYEQIPELFTNADMLVNKRFWEF